MLTRKAALAEGERNCRVNDTSIKRWEGGLMPRADHLRWLARAIEKPVEHLTALARQDVIHESTRDVVTLPPAQPADADYVEAIHATIDRLVRLEVQHGGDEVAPLAVRYLQAARRRFDSGGHEPRIELDLMAAVAELAEVAVGCSMTPDSTKRRSGRIMKLCSWRASPAIAPLSC